MSRISPEPYFHTTNDPFRAFQNLVSEHSVEGVPASLYNLTKSVPDPLPKYSLFRILRPLPACPPHCIKISWATHTNKRIHCSFITIVPYGEFIFLSIIAAKHAQIYPFFFCTPHVILHKKNITFPCIKIP